ncbi:unnamed protein product, partial [Effrenium voratum]
PDKLRGLRPSVGGLRAASTQQQRWAQAGRGPAKAGRSPADDRREGGPGQMQPATAGADLKAVCLPRAARKRG